MGHNMGSKDNNYNEHNRIQYLHVPGFVLSMWACVH